MEKSGFFKSNDGDRVYRTNEIANFFSKIFSNGIFNNGCKVIANDNMTVTVTEGYAFINGYWYHNDSDKILNLELADTNQSRIDNIVLRYTTENRNIEAEVIEGNYATFPIAPNLQRNTACYDLRIAKINIPMGADGITQSMIEDCRFNSDDCGNVVCLIEQIDTSDIFNQYQATFMEWFENLKLNLDANVAANLQNKINTMSDDMWEVVEIPDNELDQWEADEEYTGKYLVNKKANKIFNGKIPHLEQNVEYREYNTDFVAPFDCYAEVSMISSGWGFGGDEVTLSIVTSGDPEKIIESFGKTRGHNTDCDCVTSFGVYKLKGGNTYKFYTSGLNGGRIGNNGIIKLVPIIK